MDIKNKKILLEFMDYELTNDDPDCGKYYHNPKMGDCYFLDDSLESFDPDINVYLFIDVLKFCANKLTTEQQEGDHFEALLSPLIEECKKKPLLALLLAFENKEGILNTLVEVIKESK